MIIKSSLVEQIDPKKLSIQKEKVEGRFLDAVAITDNITKPAYTNILEARQEIINLKNISFPIFSDENEFVATVQVEALSQEIHESKNKKKKQEEEKKQTKA